MTVDQIKKIHKDHEGEFLKSNAKDCFLEGLQIISRLSTKHDYYAEHDVFYASNLDDIDGLTDKIVIELYRLGWHFEEELNCFAKFT